MEECKLFVRCDKLDSGDRFFFPPVLEYSTHRRRSGSTKAHARTDHDKGGEEKILVLGPLVHWFDSNCAVTRFTRQRRREMNKLKRKSVIP